MTQFAKKIKLTNGLSVIYEKNDHVGIVSLQIGVRVGSANEKNDESGLCHLIEHMVFKGTQSFAPGEIATLVEAHGGELNAYTSLDQTVYYINLPSRHIAIGLKLIKEMVFDAKMDAAELEREKEVVIEEIRRGQDSPHRVLSETLFSAFYGKHPYGRPVIGTAELVKGYSSEKIKAFYKKHYAPQNMILAVCGHVDEAELSAHLESLFRFEPNSPLHSPEIPPPELKDKPQTILRTMDIQATYFDLAFDAPNIAHRDVPALDILSHLLGESDTSLLEQNVRQNQQLVHSIYSSAYTPKQSGLFIIGGQVDPDKLNAALAAIVEEITKTQTELFDDEKIQRAKHIARARLIYEQETCEGTARKWITYETTVGDYNFDEKYIEAIGKLTADDIRNTAVKYLNLTAVTLTVLHPSSIKLKIDSRFTQGPKSRTNLYKPKTTYKDAQIFKLDNGLRLIIKENHRLPIVSIKAACRGGLRYETSANNGITSLMANALTKGTETLDQLQIAERCEWLSASLSAFAGRNSFGVSFSFLSEKTRQALPLFADILLRPAFNAEEVAKEKVLHLEGIKNFSDSSSQLVYHNVLKTLFKGHPYERHLIGTKKSVKALTPALLKKYHQAFLCPENLVIAVVGDVDTQATLDLFNREFVGLKSRKFLKKNFKKPSLPKNVVKIFEVKNKKQAHVAIGFLSNSLYDKDRYAMQLLSSLLSGQGGRLFLELRDKQSLAYTVGSSLIEGVETGFFSTYIGSEPSKVPVAMREMLAQLDKLKNEPIPEVELTRTKNYVIGNHEIDHQKNSAIAMQLCLNELYGKKLSEFFDFENHVMAVTAQDITKAARKYLTLDKMVVGVVGPQGTTF